MTQTNLAEKIIADLKKQDRLSFVELGLRIPEAKGNHDLIRERDNVLLGFGLSAEAVDAMVQLLREARIYLDPVAPIIYLVDGCIPQVPIAKKAPEGGYKNLHWVPTVIALGQPKKAKKAKKAAVKR